MRQYERSGVTVDQCGECRGIFLDRGELERLTDAETSFHSAQRPPAPAAYGDPPPQSYGQPGYSGGYSSGGHSGHGGGHGGYGVSGYPRKRKKSLFEELFD